jgi:hypothetical protein
MDWNKLVVTQQGGFTGVIRCAELESAKLDTARRQNLTALLIQARLDSQSRVKPTVPGPDQQMVQIECFQGPETWLASFNQADLPESVARLVKVLSFRPIAPR